MHSQQPPGVVQNWSTLQCSKQNTEQCGYDHAPVTRGRMRAQFPLPHGPPCWGNHHSIGGGIVRERKVCTRSGDQAGHADRSKLSSRCWCQDIGGAFSVVRVQCNSLGVWPY